jgi:hypothetical protein
MTAILVIDRSENRARMLADAMRAVGGVSTFVWTVVNDAGDIAIRERADDREGNDLDTLPTARLVLHHYRDHNLKAVMAQDGVEVWYGGGGAQPSEGREWNIHVVLDANAVGSLSGDCLEELVNWARMDAATRAAAPVPRLLKRPAPDALLAYHLLAMLGEEGREVQALVKDRALAEAKSIAGASSLTNFDNANERKEFLRRHC